MRNGERTIRDMYRGMEPRQQTYRMTKEMLIPYVGCKCGKPTIWRVDGEWATGVKLSSGYTPQKDELVKNHYMECTECGDWQVS